MGLDLPSTDAHESLNLYISDETFTFEPVYSDPKVQRHTLVIYRSNGVIQLNAPPAPTLRQEEVLNILGIIGIIRLNAVVHVKETLVKERKLTLALISRRSKYRAGTRFNVRGIDQDGYVANFVETEQIVLTDIGYKASYTQIRGSIPLFWKQIPNVKYQPKLLVEQNPITNSAFTKHFSDLYARYSSVIAVNLINRHGYERPLGVEFERLIKDDLDKQGHFLITDAGLVLKSQSSVVRTNCIDCLDRTNVVQSVMARKVLKEQLQYLGYIDEDESIESQQQLETVFRAMWADNADEISRQYSGTGALKTDFTRTGKRTREGVLNDLMNSIVRYIKNNYLDGARQVVGH
ncbi:hypothetical protein HDU96_000788 [Phlyctochytrium bullatum]|nr:hypothetical protein HDU96_000788 [Phlyctochytrium bullatum]